MRFFIDNNLSLGLARGMAAFGEDVVHLQDMFAADTPDEEWLRHIGEQELVLVTRDTAIRRRPAELSALRDNNVRAFFLGGKNLKRCDLIQQLVRNWPRMKEVAVKQAPPFAFRVRPKGTQFDRIAL